MDTPQSLQLTVIIPAYRMHTQTFINTLDSLSEDVPMGMNISFVPETLLNFIGMCIGRADYLCGQIGLMRRILNYPGMKYDLNEQVKY